MNNGKPYAPYRFKEIVKERWYISKSINTSYNDLGKITPREKDYILEFIIEENKRTEDYIKKQKEAAANRK